MIIPRGLTLSCVTDASKMSFSFKTVPLIKKTHFYFLLSISRESIVFESNFRKGDFDGITHSKAFEIQKPHFFFGWSVYVSVISITKKKLQQKLQIWLFDSVSYVDAT